MNLFLSKLKKIKNSKMFIIILALLVIWSVFIVITDGNFISSRNISNLLRQMSITGILSIGMIFIIISGEIDLSVGSQMALLGGLAAIMDVNLKFPLMITIIITLILGLILGIWNGYWIANKNVPSFIVTLAGMLVFRGILIGITGGKTISPISSTFKILGQSYIPKNLSYILALIFIILIAYIKQNERKLKIKHNIQVVSFKEDIFGIIVNCILLFSGIIILNKYEGIPTPVLLMSILIIIFSFISNKTVYGRIVYAIGGNINAVKYSGIDTKKIKLKIYIINGILVSIAGLVLTSRLGAGSVSAGTNAELDTIAACVIGGASLSGGKGKVIGAILGALIMTSLDNGMSMLNVGPAWQYVVKGIILLFAVLFDIQSQNNKK
ncbi:sugar ABC transporter permease [Oceanivirga salmonicida]|uniref:sugar ABC transporter permease n=1 Tax=Oceanivirga salmonicida TaxID=1769291 RepID=UPI0012E2EC9B|nr:sugar ABC transporter permease [Oceanivirga salmonicida]